MKKMLALLLTLLLLYAMPAGAYAEAAASTSLTPVEQLVDTDGNVIFSDTIVEQAIRDCLGMPEGPITKKQLAGMGSKYQLLYISVPEPKTLDLSLLQLCTKLKLLILDGVTPADWSVIGMLKGMTYFSACNLSLTDLSFLAGHKKLLDLELENSTCRDISAVTQIPQLYTFRSDLPIADITPLLACKKLGGVTLPGLTDEQINELLDALGKKLKVLGLKDCAPSAATVERIAALKLQSISLDNVALDSLAPIFGIKTLKWSLTLANMELPSLAGLEGLKKLTTITLDHVTGLTDYSLLYQMPGMMNLTIGGCDAPNLTGIESMKKLKYLSLHDLTGNLALAPVFTLKKLQQLSLNNVEIDTLTGIENMEKLDSLYFYEVRGITDFTPLSGLKKIQFIGTDMADQLPEGLPAY